MPAIKINLSLAAIKIMSYNVYKKNSVGSAVKIIQSALEIATTGIFDNVTEAAVRKFQADNDLVVDGIVGEKTLQKLFPSIEKDVLERKADRIIFKSLLWRCLALTGTFETGKKPPYCFAGITGNFDGQGISFGICQWNLGQNSLQPLLKEMLDKYPDETKEIFKNKMDVYLALLQKAKDAVNYSIYIQHPTKFTIYEPYYFMFEKLGASPSFQKIQCKYAKEIYNRAKKLAVEYLLYSDRGISLIFDILVQNGGISGGTKRKIFGCYKKLSLLKPNPLNRWLIRYNLRQSVNDIEKEDIQKMVIIAKQRADASKPRWRKDVLSRKLCIAEGNGIVHGSNYNLANFGLLLEPSIFS